MSQGDIPLAPKPPKQQGVNERALDSADARSRCLLSSRRRLLEREELLRAESLVVNLRRGLDEIL